jgi:G3E family GTPase
VSAAIPFTVIGGFLGAGKTTLLNRLLAGTSGRRFAVLVNDFGAVEIDGRLVIAHGGDTIALANGCVCCTIGDSLIETVMRLLESPERLDHIVVEASGVADPGRIADLGVLDPRLLRDGVIVVVDAADIRTRAADRRLADTVQRQLEAADLIVLNKIDLVDELAAMRCWLSTRSTAPVLEASQCDVPLDLLFGLDRRGSSGKSTPPGTFRSWSYSWPNPVDRAALLDVLHDSAVLRGKGIVRFSDAPDRRSVVHMVGKRVDVTDAGPWSDTDESQLVLLGLKPVLGSL